MSPTAFIVEQIESGRESWKVAHEEAMECRALEARLRHGLGQFWLIRSADEAWSNKVQNREAEFDEEVVREIDRQYRWWLEPCDGILRRLDQLERQFKVEHADQFRECVRSVRQLMSIGTDELLKSARQVAAGETVPFPLPPE